MPILPNGRRITRIRLRYGTRERVSPYMVLQETGPAVSGGFRAALGESRGKPTRNFESALGCQLHCFIPVQAVLPRFGTGGPGLGTFSFGS
jgi:hypothetical protein